MTPAQRLARLPGCWRGGMLVLQYGVPARLVGQDHLGRWIAWDRSGVWVRYTDMTGIVPDLADPATIGCLATWCREVYRLPDLYCRPLLPGGWTVGRPCTLPHIVFDDVYGTTEGDAWAAAILAKLEPK